MKKSMKDLLNKVYEDGRVFAKNVPFETYFKDEKSLVRLCIRDRDANGIENE
tara:strand:+ start:479 stop:634 length:156 start_codon:yes stop_codon:yes gene_type:complete